MSLCAYIKATYSRNLLQIWYTLSKRSDDILENIYNLDSNNETHIKNKKNSKCIKKWVDFSDLIHTNNSDREFSFFVG